MFFRNIVHLAQLFKCKEAALREYYQHTSSIFCTPLFFQILKPPSALPPLNCILPNIGAKWEVDGVSPICLCTLYQLSIEFFRKGFLVILFRFFGSAECKYVINGRLKAEYCSRVVLYPRYYSSRIEDNPGVYIRMMTFLQPHIPVS